MAFVFFSAFDKTGTYRECCFGGADLEHCLDVLSELINAGWQLVAINYTEYLSELISLPISAFDGQNMTMTIYDLQKSWKGILNLP